LIIDTETAQGLESPIVYDIGLIIANKQGDIYHTQSFIIDEVFYNNELMDTAYYRDKVPLYNEMVDNGEIWALPFRDIREYILESMVSYQIQHCMAFNAIFDRRALNNTMSWINYDLKKFYFPYGIKWYCIMKLAKQTIGKTENYKKWCELFPEERKYGKYLQFCRGTAEMFYQYITDNPNYEENHTGLSDAFIELEIYKYCKENFDISGVNWKL